MDYLYLEHSETNKKLKRLYNVEINKNIFRCVYRGKNKLINQFKNPLISGDIVDIKMLDDGTGVIEKVYKRKNYFIWCWKIR